jgi:hypothetical protein
MRFSKISNKIQAFSVKAYRKSEKKSQSNKKIISSSTEFVLQNIHFRSFNGIFGLVYRPVSIANGGTKNVLKRLITYILWI